MNMNVPGVVEKQNMRLALVLFIIYFGIPLYAIDPDAVILSNTVSLAHTIHAESLPRQIKEEYFGMATYDPPPPDLRYGIARSFNYGVAPNRTTWCYMQPTPTTWNWTKADQFIATNAGRKIMWTLGHPPQWATGSTTNGGNGIGTSHPPTNDADWVNYVSTLAQRYGDAVTYWELWNEPSFKYSGQAAYYIGTPERLAELARLAYQTIKKIHPKAIIVSPGFVSDPNRLAQFLDASAGDGSTHGKDWIEGVSYHFYPVQVWQTTLNIKNIVVSHESVKTILRDRGLQLPIFCTEVGTRKFPTASDEERRLYLERILAYGLILGWDALIFMCYDRGAMAIKSREGTYDLTDYWNNALRAWSGKTLTRGYLTLQPDGEYKPYLEFSDGTTWSR